jgi:hypothetical protein
MKRVKHPRSAVVRQITGRARVPSSERERTGMLLLHVRLAVGAALCATLAGCRAERIQPAPMQYDVDPRTVLRAQLSHGIGASVLDDLLWEDSAHAALLVASASGRAEADLIRLAERPDSGRARVGRLLERGLLVRNNEHLRSSFPILVGRRAEDYYRLVDATAQAAMIAVLPALDSVLDVVKSRGWEDWSYHFLWSQVLDSQFAWAEMVGRGMVPPLTTVVAWVVYPAHPWKTGTNYVPEEAADYFMAISWTPQGSSLSNLYADWRPIYESAVARSSVSATAADRLRALNLLAADGTPLMPVIGAGDPLYGQLQSLASRVLTQMTEHLPLAELEMLTGLEHRLLFAMAYHDIGWGMLRLAADSGRVQRPPALTDSVATDMRGAAAIIQLHPPFLELFGMQPGAT